MNAFAGSCILADVCTVGCRPHHEPHEIGSGQYFHRCNCCSYQHGLLRICSSCLVSRGFWIQALQTNVYVNHHHCRRAKHIMWSIHYGLLIWGVRKRNMLLSVVLFDLKAMCYVYWGDCCCLPCLPCVYIELFAECLNTIVFLPKTWLSSFSFSEHVQEWRMEPYAYFRAHSFPWCLWRAKCLPIL